MGNDYGLLTIKYCQKLFEEVTDRVNVSLHEVFTEILRYFGSMTVFYSSLIPSAELSSENIEAWIL